MIEESGLRAIFKEKIGLVDAKVNGRAKRIGSSDFVGALFFKSVQINRRRRRYDQFRKKQVEMHATKDGWCKVSITGIGTLFYPLPFNDADADAALREIFRVIIDRSSDHYYEKQGTAVESEDIVADCGAAEGSFALAVHNKCKKVYAIDPNRTFGDCMRKTFAEIPNVEIVQVGLSDEKKTAHLQDHGCGSQVSDGQADYDIELTTIDDLFYEKGERLDYIKADLEGHEIKMLSGAKKTIREYGPRISITTYHVPSHSDQIASLLLEIDPDYKVYTVGIRSATTSGLVECWPAMLHAWIQK
jgi:FkbM family methyltransferase